MQDRGGRGRGSDESQHEGGPSRGRDRGCGTRQDQGQAVQGRGRGHGMSSTSTNRVSKCAAATKDGNDSLAKRSKSPQHQLMLKNTAHKEIPTSQAIVQVESLDEVHTTSQAISPVSIQDSCDLEVIMNNVVIDTSRE